MVICMRTTLRRCLIAGSPETVMWLLQNRERTYCMYVLLGKILSKRRKEGVNLLKI